MAGRFRYAQTLSTPGTTVPTMPAEHHVYAPLEAPDVEVLVDGNWWPGEARMRTTHRDGRVTYQVQYRTEDGTHLDVFPADRVRLDETDHSRGRMAE